MVREATLLKSWIFLSLKPLFVFILKLFTCYSFILRTSTKQCIVIWNAGAKHEWVCSCLHACFCFICQLFSLAETRFFMVFSLPKTKNKKTKKYFSVLIEITCPEIISFLFRTKRSSFKIIFEGWFLCGIVYGTCDLISGSNFHITDAIRMQMEVNRRLHEQLEVSCIKIHSKIFFPLINKKTKMFLISW